jgi:hypothetical protein
MKNLSNKVFSFGKPVTGMHSSLFGKTEKKDKKHEWILLFPSLPVSFGRIRKMPSIFLQLSPRGLS